MSAKPIYNATPHSTGPTTTARLSALCLRFWANLDAPFGKHAGGSIRRKGVALLLVLSYVAFMSVTVLAGFQNSQVSFSISSNIRDEMKAYYKAKSAINLGRLMLTYQYELEEDEFFGQRIRRSNFQMYQILDLLMMPFKSGIISVDVPNANHTIASFDLKGAGVDAMGEDSGDFNVHVFPEAGRINVNKFANDNSPGAVQELCMLIANKEYDDLFNASGFKSDRLNRMDFIAAIIDWVDRDSERSYINNNCVLEESSGDEASLYVEQRKRYKVKNAKFTTLDELYEIAGFGDDIMEAFGETLTVYPVEKINVNLAPAKVLYTALCSSAETDAAQAEENKIWACADPTMGQQLLILSLAIEGYQQFVSNPMNILYLYTVEKEASVIPGVVPNGTIVPFRNVSEFQRVLKAMIEDATLIPKFLLYSPTAYLLLGEKMTTITTASLGLSDLTFSSSKLYASITTASPRIFRVVAVGEYAGTRQTLSVVIDFNTTGGKYLYWREF